jgi:hypothetical protein
VTTQAQILKGLITPKKLKEATSLLGIKKTTKDAKLKCNMFENVPNALKYIGKSRKVIDRIARREYIVSSTTKNNCLTNLLAKAMGTS